MGSSSGPRFPPISTAPPVDRRTHAVAADLDGTLLVSRSSFPYFMLLAVEAGSPLRGAVLLLASPLVLLLYSLVSESAGIQLMVYVSVSRLPIAKVEATARGVLARFYAEDVRRESWEVFKACGGRKAVVTANPRVVVEAFVKEGLGGDVVLGSELEVDRNGRATGWVKSPGVLVGTRKRDAVVTEFRGKLPDVGLGDRESDHCFMELCKEAYMVIPNPSAAKVSPQELGHIAPAGKCYFSRRPDPLHALLTFIWIPIGFVISLPRNISDFVFNNSHKS